MNRLVIPSSATDLHVEAYKDAIRLALDELVIGHSLHIKTVRDVKVWIDCSEVSGYASVYINWVRRLNRAFGLLTARPLCLSCCKSLFERCETRLMTRFPSTKNAAGRKRKSPQIEQWEKGKEVIARIFDYKRFGTGDALKCDQDVKGGYVFRWVENSDKWSAWHFIKALNAEACSYCNAEGVYALLLNHKLPGSNTCEKNPIKYSRSPLDHYFSRAKYPFLGLSLCNLVPACTRCNTGVKGSKELTISGNVHPHNEGFDDAVRFLAVFDTYAAIQCPSESNTMIVICGKTNKGSKDVGLTKRGIATARFFHLDEVYNQTYKEEVVDIVRRIVMMPESYREDLMQRYPGMDKLVLDRMFIGAPMDREQMNKRRMSKASIDLYEQLHVNSPGILKHLIGI